MLTIADPGERAGACWTHARPGGPRTTGRRRFSAAVQAGHPRRDRRHRARWHRRHPAPGAALLAATSWTGDGPVTVVPSRRWPGRPVDPGRTPSPRRSNGSPGRTPGSSSGSRPPSASSRSREKSPSSWASRWPSRARTTRAGPDGDDPRGGTRDRPGPGLPGTGRQPRHGLPPPDHQAAGRATTTAEAGPRPVG